MLRTCLTGHRRKVWSETFHWWYDDKCHFETCALRVTGRAGCSLSHLKRNQTLVARADRIACLPRRRSRVQHLGHAATVAPLRPCSCASHCSAYGRSPPCSCLIADTPAHCWRYDCVHAGHSPTCPRSRTRAADPSATPSLFFRRGNELARFLLQSSPDPLARDRMRAVHRNCRGGARALLAWHALGGRLRAWCRGRAARCYSAYGSNEAHAPASSTDYGP